jgi:outer membrane receptor for ferrienterochelin and colicins
MNYILKQILIFLLLLVFKNTFAQKSTIHGFCTINGTPLRGIVVRIEGKQQKQSISDKSGNFSFSNLDSGTYKFFLESSNFNDSNFILFVPYDSILKFTIELSLQRSSFKEMVVSGSLRQTKRLESPVAIEVFYPSFFKKNPVSNLFESLQNVNGVRPQVNCNVCNTGDIHINGLEGPYTMVLIDGMPIVSSLSTVYGLYGIPNALIDRIEIVKGPASTLYGSEAIGGIINVITKNPDEAGTTTVDMMTSSWKELQTDIGFNMRLNKKVSLLNGINYYNFNQTIDKNNDQFTDLTLQHRISLFQKYKIERKDFKVFNVAARYFYENRWGGDLRWNRSFRGGDSIYAESIYTSRIELLGNYELPGKSKAKLSFSINRHHQNSMYGIHPFIATQSIGFLQLTNYKKIKKSEFMYGLAFRQTYYDDNTVATQNADSTHPRNMPNNTALPGIFLQDEIEFNSRQKLLLGMRYDYNSNHGNIFTPRAAFKHIFNINNTIRFNFGTGYRVVNVFTEDHAALTGARNVILEDQLKPEKSYNINFNYIKKIIFKKYNLISLDFSLFYSYFNNRIIANYDIDPNKIIYKNLNGYAVSRGASANINVSIVNGIKGQIGITTMDVYTIQNHLKTIPVLTEKVSATWSLSQDFKKLKISLDYTGNLYSPMRLPLLGELDPRSEFSPWWSIQNIQMTYKGFKSIKLFGCIKNLLNWTPAKNNPFIIARANDPFDKKVQYNSNGQILASSNNPYALSFDPSYVYAPNQGIRFFLGFNLEIEAHKKKKALD